REARHAPWPARSGVRRAAGADGMMRPQGPATDMGAYETLNRPSSDFNHDGISDIVWRNYATGENKIWFMSGATAVSSAALPALADLNWQLAGTGDFNGDSQEDLVFHNIATGATQVWTMNGAAMTGTLALPLQADINWQLVAVGDLNPDAQPEPV